ncbi:hypothetical protein [Amycolatopsis taiwanensis]|nr:hypothetical protein [Amycolatopsis taiwanensis]
MKVAVQVRRARIDGRDWRVISPADGTGNAGLWTNDYWRELYVDRRAAYRIGVLWLLAARSRHTIIYLPLRNGRQPAHPEHDGRRMDLVLSQHSLCLRASQWPRLRSALGRGLPQTAQVPANYLPDPAGIDYEARHHRDNRDRLRERIHGDTLFLTGSTPVFRETADRFFDIAFGAPGSAPGEEPPAHYCARFHWADGVLSNTDEIHVQYRSRWLTAV